MALILTLWVLAALIVLAGGLAVMVRTETQTSRNFADLTRCRWAAKAGVNSGTGDLADLGAQMNSLSLTLSSEDEQIDLGDASFETTIEDEAGKMNLNTAPPDVLEALFDSREIADCIIDWRDEDDTPGSQGAETDHYLALPTPYRCKNAPFDTVRELLLVKGVTNELLSTPVTSNGRTLEGMLTVYSRDNNLTNGGEKRIDIRTAGKEELKSILGQILTDEEIDAIVSRRTTGTNQSAGSAADVLRGANVPREKIQRVYDLVTNSNETTRPGLVNINTGPVEVLAVLPGLNSGMAEEIVSYRTANGAFVDVGALLQVSAVTDEAFARSADLLTARSSVFKIVSVGRLAPGWSSCTITCVADATGGNAAQIKYWRE